MLNYTITLFINKPKTFKNIAPKFTQHVHLNKMKICPIEKYILSV